MKRLHQIVVDHEARLYGDTAPATREVSSPAELESVEQRLGVSLSRAYKSFAREVGSAVWPVEIRAASSLARYEPALERPAFLLPFASDGSGNDWCFDTRASDKGEHGIVLWDHEDAEAQAALSEIPTPTSFDEWLKDLVNERVTREEGDALAERHKKLEGLLAPHRPTSTWPFAPSAEDVAKVEAELRISLPKDYVWLTTNLGSIAWPLEIVDALEIARLTEEMRRKFPNARGVSAAIGREADGSYVGLQKLGKLIAVGGRPIEEPSFLDFLERRIEQRSRSKAPPPMAESAATPTRRKMKPRGAGGADKSAAKPPADGASASDEQIPWRIVEDERINSVWRAVAEAKEFSATKEPDGRIQVVISDFMSGKRRMFLDADAWAVVEQHLAARKK